MAKYWKEIVKMMWDWQRLGDLGVVGGTDAEASWSGYWAFPPHSPPDSFFKHGERLSNGRP